MNNTEPAHTDNYNSEYVSIIIPTYNRASIIKDSVLSVLNQTYDAYEILIIDDGSVDNTETVINSLNDDRIRYIKLPENRGVAAARNEGIRNAIYEYIAFQDSDDNWKPDKLEKQMAYFKTKPQAALLYCPYECRKQDGTALSIPDDTILPSEKEGNIYKYMLQRNTIGAPCVLLRKSCLDKTGLFNENLRCLEDWELFLRISKYYEIAFQNEAMVKVNLSDSGVSHNVSGYYEARCHMLALHKDALLEYGLFETVSKDILDSADKLGILPQISKLMQYYLTT